MKSKFKSRRHDPANCPHCGELIDAAAPIDGGERKPQDGDVGICFNCGGWMEYDRIDGRLIPIMPSPAIMDELRTDPRAMAFELDIRMRAQVNAMRKQAGNAKEAGKLVFKKQGGFIECYICKPDGDEDDTSKALLLATIRQGMVRDPERRQAWISLLKHTIGDMFREISGGETMWVNENETINRGRAE